MTLRDLVGSSPPLLHNRTPEEDRVTAQMPGDVPEEHPLHAEPNPFMDVPHGQLKSLLVSGTLPDVEERLVREALRLLQSHHSA